jgi:hypothetical protein
MTHNIARLVRRATQANKHRHQKETNSNQESEEDRSILSDSCIDFVFCLAHNDEKWENVTTMSSRSPHVF